MSGHASSVSVSTQTFQFILFPVTSAIRLEMLKKNKILPEVLEMAEKTRRIFLRHVWASQINSFQLFLGIDRYDLDNDSFSEW